MEDIELDIQELKCLIQSMSIDTNPVLKIATRRDIYQTKKRSDALAALLDATFVIIPAKQSASTAIRTDLEHKVVADLTKEIPAETVFMQGDEVPTPQILAEHMKLTIDLCHVISLSDSFRFTHELLNEDMTRMSKIVGQLGETSSLKGAMSAFMLKIQLDEESEAAVDFVELLRKYLS